MESVTSHLVQEKTLRDGITGVVLTMNGERLLDKCLASLHFCDALLVVDSGSTDSTKEISDAHNATFIYNAWQGFDSQFTFAQTQVTTRWFFILDQDEICSSGLATCITDAVQGTDANTHHDAPVAFSVGRTSWYFDRFMKHGGWHPDFILRVFQTGRVSFYQDAHIHYRPDGPSAKIGTSEEEIVHYPYTSFTHQLAKLNMYADQGAESLRKRGKSGGILRGIGHGFARFLRIYILKRGFLDGRAGFLAACHGSFYAFLKYVRVLDASWGAPFDKK